MIDKLNKQIEKHMLVWEQVESYKSTMERSHRNLRSKAMSTEKLRSPAADRASTVLSPKKVPEERHLMIQTMGGPTSPTTNHLLQRSFKRRTNASAHRREEKELL